MAHIKEAVDKAAIQEPQAAATAQAVHTAEVASGAGPHTCGNTKPHQRSSRVEERCSRCQAWKACRKGKPTPSQRCSLDHLNEVAVEASIARVNRAAEEAGAREGSMPGDAASVAVPGDDASGDEACGRSKRRGCGEQETCGGDEQRGRYDASVKQAWAQAVSSEDVQLDVDDLHFGIEHLEYE